MSAMLRVVLFLSCVAFAFERQNEQIIWKQPVIRDWHAMEHHAVFQHWQEYFNKTYATLHEREHRFSIWRRNWQMINEFNQQTPARTFIKRLNQFGDLTADEFRFVVNGPTGNCFNASDDNVTSLIKRNATSKTSNLSVPASIDWTNVDGKSYVSAVKNQGKCGACWAFSAAGAIESHTAIKRGLTDSEIVALSVQQLMDCSSEYGNKGCNGGEMPNAFRYVVDSGGLCSDASYPYKGAQGECHADTCGTFYDAIASYSGVEKEDEVSMMEALSKGPVSIGVEADQSSFQFYGGGILDGLCGTSIDHGVLMVGYGTKSGMDFWKVKNSWGTDWGEDGYVLMCRSCQKNGDKGECGVLVTPAFPNV